MTEAMAELITESKFHLGSVMRNFISNLNSLIVVEFSFKC